jgi:hypothetical protein
MLWQPGWLESPFIEKAFLQLFLSCPWEFLLKTHNENFISSKPAREFFSLPGFI